MNVDDIYSSGKSLKAEDLKGRAHKLKISEVETAKFDNGMKLVLKFDGKEKGLVLNKTNAKVVAKYYGKDTLGWVGKQIEIFPTETEFNGSLVDCIRVRVEPPATDGDFDDDIGF